MTAAFWILAGLSFLGTFAVLEYGIKSGPNGGAVGAWLLFIPILLLGILPWLLTLFDASRPRRPALASAYRSLLPALFPVETAAAADRVIDRLVAGEGE